VQPKKPSEPAIPSSTSSHHGFLEKEKAMIEKEKALLRKIELGRGRLKNKFPIVFTLAGTFGLVATFYGFQEIINRIEWLRDNPLLILIVGITTLVITGRLYQKLD
jgi:hypothetical protein